ncbi:MAG: hypothetical protein ACE5JS_02605 [Nitrospinota bacterium]
MAEISKRVVFLALLLAGTAGAALAQEQLVSGVPHEGYLKGVLVQANGPVLSDEVVTEGPSLLVKVERQTIRMRSLNAVELAEVNPEAFIGIPVDLDVTPVVISGHRGDRKTN